MTNFSVLEISAAAFENAQEIEGGAAEKYRVNLPDPGTVILKLDEESLNGAWVEKITHELAKLIDLPAATYEFAELFDGRRAIISGDYLQPNHNEQSGKSLLNQCFGKGNYSYTVETVLTTADLNQIALPLKYILPPQVETAADLLAGYLVFDYWIDNIDRHYENWGIQIDTTTGRKELLPTYDHGLGLGYLLFEEEYLDLDPANHVQNQSSAFSGSKGRSLSMSGMLATVVSIKPNAVRVWMERITQIDSQIVTQLFDRIPDGWIGEPAKNFAIELLEFNRQQIASICELILPLENVYRPHPDNSPEPPNDSPDPPSNPRIPPQPPTPPNSPDAANSPNYLNSIATIEKIASAYYKRAVLQGYDLDDLSGALANFNKAIELNPQFADAYYSRAVLKQTKLNDVSGALIDLSKAIELNPQFADAYHHRANLKQTRLRNVAGALVDYDRAIELNPQSIDAYCNRAILKQFRLNDVPGALADFNKAIELNPQDGNIYYNLANLKQTKLDDISGALADYDKAIELNPQYANAYYGRANLKQTKLDDISGSIIDFRAAATFYQQQDRLEDWEDTIDRIKKLEGTT